jgi:hypothetical protein
MRNESNLEKLKKRNVHLDLMPRLRMRGAIFPLPQNIMALFLIKQYIVFFERYEVKNRVNFILQCSKANYTRREQTSKQIYQKIHEEASWGTHGKGRERFSGNSRRFMKPLLTQGRTQALSCCAERNTDFSAKVPIDSIFVITTLYLC